MNRAIVRRWINEYLDGEIGLADKVELERLMAEYPEIRKEYKELRKISLHLGSTPEVVVHPTRFRAKVMNRLINQESQVFTPQRAFAGSMLVAFIVVTLTFGLLLYNLYINQDALPTSSEMVVADQGYSVSMIVKSSSTDFFNRLMVESELGMVSPSLIQPFTGVYEGAKCVNGSDLRRIEFLSEPSATQRVTLSPSQISALMNVAEGLTGSPVTIQVAHGEDTEIDFSDFLELNGSKMVNLTIRFR